MLRQHEVFFPSIPLGGQKFSDTGYRLRRNVFVRDDNWIPFTTKEKTTFYDSLVFNSDTFDVPKEHNLIAELYFRVFNDEKEHTRIVFQFMNWLASIGGIEWIIL